MTPLQRTQQAVAGHMEAIQAMFKPGAKITVLIRVPDYPDRDFLMTDDDLAQVREMLDRRITAGMDKPT